MRERHDPVSPFGVTLWFDKGEIDEICLQVLRDQKCLPDEPCPIEIENFIERQWCPVEYLDGLGDAVLGFTQFAQDGKVLRMGASSSLYDGGKAGGRRARSTLAHEAGHGLLHAQLFINPPRTDLFPEGMYDSARRQIMCRERDMATGYKGKWWEYQANQAIGGLLLPRPLMRKAMAPFLESQGLLGQSALAERDRENAVLEIARVFDVNPAAARIRVSELYPQKSGQMEL